jgi:L-fuculose-phosphate aldolase
MIGEFRRIGDMMFLSQIVDASSGNLSCRTKDGVWITKTGKSLYNLRGKDIVKIGFERDVRWNAASSEVDIHINIYKNIEDAKAILHAHCPYTVALSLKQNKIAPIDYEGRLFLKEVDILDIAYNNWQSAKNEIPQYFKDNPKKQIVIAKGHGVFAYSDTLFSAYQLVSALENSSKILTIGGFYG